MASLCENTILVNAIEKYPCLYNTTIPEYSRKDLTEQAWKDVANQTQLSVPECKEKWKNLRYGLLRSLRPHISGQVKKKYYLHNEMEFVIPFIKHSKQPRTEDDTYTDEENCDQDFAIMEHSFIPEQFFDEDNIEPPQKKKKTREPESFMNVDHGTIDQSISSRKMFLLGLLPEVNSLTENQMRIFRRKILALLDDIVGGSSREMSLQEMVQVKMEPL